MKKYLLIVVFLFLVVYLLTGCIFGPFDDSDQIMSVDKSVKQETTSKITTYLLNKVPEIRNEKDRLVASNGKIRLTLSIISSPEPEFSKLDPDYKYHANFYWVYVSYMTKEKLIKYDTYLVHQDLTEIYYVDSESDNFVKVK